MKKHKVIKWLIVGSVTLTMLMGTGCALFAELPGIDSGETPPEIDGVNSSPEISSLDPSATSVALEESCTISCTASDADGDTLTYDWTATGGTVTGEGSTITWIAPAAEGSYTITVTVSDGKGGTASDSCTVTAETRSGSIDIQSSPDGAAVYLDGVDTGNITPYIITNLEPGAYTIKLDLFHYEYREETVTVNADETTYINWSLTHAPEQTVATQPASAAGKDSTVSITAPSTNYGDQDDLIAGDRAMGIYRAYLQFDLDSIPDDAVILDARLGLYYYNSITTNTGEIGAYLVEESWNEGTITWNNQPAVSTTAEDELSLSGSSINVFVYWYIGDVVKGWWDGSIPNYGVMLRETDEGGWHAWKYFRSSDWGSASFRPKLEVLYYDPNP
jgi:hypothetical protein